jgi:hypothetical protein
MAPANRLFSFRQDPPYPMPQIPSLSPRLRAPSRSASPVSTTPVPPAAGEPPGGRAAASVEHRLLPSVALQGAVGTLGGFLGFFIAGNANLTGMIEFTGMMMTVTMLAIVLAYSLGPALRLTGRRLFKLGFMLPGLLLIIGGSSHLAIAAAFGLFMGLTASARVWLEMNLVADRRRDAYAAKAGASTIALSLLTTFMATLVLSSSGEDSQVLFTAYGAACLAGGLLFGNRLPDTPPVALVAPLAVMRQPAFVACLPLFFLQSGLFGMGMALGAAGAAHAMGAASSLGWTASAAAVVGGLALWTSRNLRNPSNRARWMALACVGVIGGFALLGASAWEPQLFIAYMVLMAAVGPFWGASEHVLNQRTLEVKGALPDVIVAREVVYWMSRMIVLTALWFVSQELPPTTLIAGGAATMALAAALQYRIARAWMKPGASPGLQIA